MPRRIIVGLPVRDLAIRDVVLLLTLDISALHLSSYVLQRLLIPYCTCSERAALIQSST